MAKQRKPDAAERIAGTVEHMILNWHSTEEHAWKTQRRLVASIRRAIRAAVKADRKGRGKR